jgi:HPt (histidine-containing phosphotransfer) domain-containing protein
MTQKRYNLDYLEEISGGDPEFILDMVRTFVENAPIDIDEIKKLVNAHNWKKAGEEAHRFASSLLFLQLLDLKAIAVEVEERGIQHNEVDKIPALLDILEKGCWATIKELKEDFKI